MPPAPLSLAPARCRWRCLLTRPLTLSLTLSLPLPLTLPLLPSQPLGSSPEPPPWRQCHPRHRCLRVG